MKKIIEKVKKSKHLPLIVSMVIVVIALILIVPSSLAAPTPVESVEIFSENADYQAGEAGAWKVTKSGKWTGSGTAQITFNLETIRKVKEGAGDSCLPADYDLILVIDTSTSMLGEKLEKVQNDTKELINNYLSEGNRQAALIQFADSSTILTDWTKDQEVLTTAIDGLQASGSTNYYQALVNVETLLESSNRNQNQGTIVLFLTDGYPNIDTPNEVAQYNLLKNKYCDLIINGVQYEMGTNILDPIKKVSDHQFIADIDSLSNVLLEAVQETSPAAGSIAAENIYSYDEIEITDYVNSTYFDVESLEDISASMGSVALEKIEGEPKITWTIEDFVSGSSATLTINIKLKEEYIGQGGLYPTNRQETITSTIDGEEDDVTSTLTPILADNYKVIYEGNAPNGCSVENVPAEEGHSVYSAVGISQEVPTCEGYQFKGWQIVTEDVEKINNESFIMPESDVVIRAEWGALAIEKTMNGIVSPQGEPIMRVYNSSSSTDYHNSIYKSSITSIVTSNSIDIPETAIESWDVSEAGDGSVIAYIEDDGSGAGTYKVTIGGTGGIIANENSSRLFYNFRNVKSIDLTYLDTSNVTNLSSMFDSCSSLISLDLSGFDTSNVTDMSSMFFNCSSLTNITFGENFDTSNVTDMSSMFSYCRSLANITFGENFDISNVTDMSSMFSYCSSLTNITFGENFDTSNVTNMSGMFESSGSYNFGTLDLSSFDTSSVTNMAEMFTDSHFSTIILAGKFNTSNVTNMSRMFGGSDMYNGSFANTIVLGEEFDTSNVTNMSYMFYNCRYLTTLDLSSFNTSKVTNMSSMFNGCSKLTSLNLSSFDTSNVRWMSSMFGFCSSLISLDLSNFDTSNVTDMSSMFIDCSSLTNITFGENFDTSNVMDMSGMFGFCSSLISLDLSGFDTSNVTDMSIVFRECNTLKNIDFGEKFITSGVTTMYLMFDGCNSLEMLDLSGFDTSNVTNMSYMFRNCSTLTSLDLSSFDTSNVTTMQSMFQYCNRLTYLDMRNAVFDATYTSMFNSANNAIEVVVKDATAQTWIQSRLDEASITGGTVTIYGA